MTMAMNTTRQTTTVCFLFFRLIPASLCLVHLSFVSSLAPQSGCTGPLAAARSPLFQKRSLSGSMAGVESHAPTRIRGPLFLSQNYNSWAPSALTTTQTTTHQTASISRRQRRGFWTTAATALAGTSVSSGTLGVVVPRSGTTTISGPAQMLLQLAVTSFGKFSSFMGSSKTRCLIMLMCSIMLECYATTLSKRAKDTGQVLVFLHACSLYLMCMVGFNISLAKLDVSIAYAVWGALGTVLVTAVGFLFFGETIDLVKILCLTLIVVGVAGLNLRG